mmetsp:Transcript_22883/g.34347  ORF Transcript_22883/g.34347 Transcript_22883/m.34347 type:complete len:300 (-) Transcript_22883:211-1110(-)
MSSVSCPQCGRTFRKGSDLLKHSENSRKCFGTNAPQAVNRGVSMWESSRNQRGVFTGSSNAQFMSCVEITDDAYNRYTDMWECSLCDRHFNSRNSLQQHINSGTHDSKGNYTCQQCGAGFSRMHALADHARMAHGQSVTSRLTNVLANDISNMNTLQITDGSSGRHEALLRFDGGARPNPGHGGCGYVLQDTISGLEMEQEGITIMQYPCTSNEAEYHGLVAGLRAAISSQVRRLRVEGDSEIVINQMRGCYNVNSYRLKPLYNEAKSLERRFQSVSFHHISRSTNWEADELASDAIEY